MSQTIIMIMIIIKIIPDIRGEFSVTDNNLTCTLFVLIVIYVLIGKVKHERRGGRFIAFGR